MINKLKKRFIILATVSFVILMLVLVSIINLVNFRTVAKECDSVLEMLSSLPADFTFQDEKRPDAKPQQFGDFVPRDMSPEVPYESRYFSVTVGSDGSVIDSNLAQIVSVDDTMVSDYIDKAISRRSDKGFVNQFRYKKNTTESGTEIIFLDCGRKLDAYKSFMFVSLLVGLGACIVVFIGFLFVARIIVKPIAESYNKQKRFISDAGHEIKTPLTIINANVDLLEIDGEKEELSDIRSQTERLTALTNDLVYLSKMEEQETKLPKVDCPFSDLVSETVATFKAPAAANAIALQTDIEQGISMVGAPEALKRLVSVLVDNAIKYTPKNGNITVKAVQLRKIIVLSVENNTSFPMSHENLENVFDRFYRTDGSRNSSTGGHGIGLSIAKAIVDAHGGTIVATTSGGCDFKITAKIPVE